MGVATVSWNVVHTPQPLWGGIGKIVDRHTLNHNASMTLLIALLLLQLCGLLTWWAVLLVVALWFIHLCLYK